MAASLLFGESLLLVVRLKTLPGWLDPDLQEVDALRGRGVRLAMCDARACAHLLHLAGANHAAPARGVAVFERALDDVGDDLHVGVRVRRKARGRRDVVLVDDEQASEARPTRV